MTIHHLNCGTLTPYWPPVQAIIYCLLVVTNQGLAVVDTGFGLDDYRTPTRAMRTFTIALRAPSSEEETAARQVVRLGYRGENVRHIVLTHLHLDHSGGLPDFPAATVHVLRREYEAGTHPRGIVGRFAYVAEHWAHGPRWVIHDLRGERWMGFDCASVVEGLSPRILLVPLPGHTPGHCGVAVQTGDGWLLHCGDAASPYAAAADPYVPTGEAGAGPLGRWFVHWMIGEQVPRLRALVQQYPDSVTLISGHDRPSWERHRAAG